MSAPANNRQVVVCIITLPFILLGMIAALCWNAIQVGYWYADSLFDP